jgi:hypothetical protein
VQDYKNFEIRRRLATPYSDFQLSTGRGYQDDWMSEATSEGAKIGVELSEEGRKRIT